MVRGCLLKKIPKLRTARPKDYIVPAATFADSFLRIRAYAAFYIQQQDKGCPPKIPCMTFQLQDTMGGLHKTVPYMLFFLTVKLHFHSQFGVFYGITVIFVFVPNECISRIFIKLKKSENHLLRNASEFVNDFFNLVI